MSGPAPDIDSLLDSAIEAHLAGRLPEAEARYRRVLAARPGDPDANNNLGHICAGRGQAQAALEHYLCAVRAAPGHALARNNLGAALLSAGRAAEAAPHLEAALRADPGSVMAHNNLGSALRQLGRAAEAVRSHERALALRPDHASAHNNLGLALFELGQRAQALRHFERAAALDPAFAEAHANRAGPLLELGDLDGALAAYEQAIALQPELRDAHTGLLLSLHYSARHGAAEILQKSRRFAARLADPLPPVEGFAPAATDPERPLRVGYVSPDLRRHAVACFLEPLLAAHDRAQVTVVAYADVPRPDEVTARLRARCDEWRDVSGLPDEALARRIRQDRIDVLVDLAGHTRRNRLLCFARRPAPVQVSYLGYPGTTGLAAIAYRLTDPVADPPGESDGQHSEALWRLPGGFLCYRPPADAPPVAPLPSLRRGALTFASFNNRPKITPPVLSAWAAILRGATGARLLLKSAGLGEAAGQERLLRDLGDLGVEPSRVELCGLVADEREHLARYGEVDVALDTFPYCGTTTTCEALWMGAPVVTLLGERHGARVGASLLRSVGLPELVAPDAAGYVERALRLAADPGRLAALRAGLRERLRASPLLDGARLAREVEAAYRAMWRAACAGAQGGPS